MRERSHLSHSDPTRPRPERSAFAEKSCAKVAPVWSIATLPSRRSLFHSEEPFFKSVSIVCALGMDPNFGVWLGLYERQMIELRIGQDNAGQRVDKFLRKRLATVPVSHLFKMIR